MKIAVLDDYAGVAETFGDWQGLGDVTVFRDTLPPGPELVARLAPFQAVCLMRERTPMPASVLEALPQLRLIVTSGPRNASIDLAAARARGITVCGTASRKTPPAELAMLMILALNRRLLPEVASLRAGTWQAGLGRDVAGLRLGIIGLGGIGTQLAAMARVFGMEAAAWSQNLTDERCAEHGVERAESLTALMEMSDSVSVQLALSDRTRGLIGAEAFSAMRPGAVFVNTSRSAIVDTAALIAGLRAGRPWMAGIDVFDVEPLPADDMINDTALQDEGRLLLTPHLGYTVEATMRLFHSQTAEAVRAFQAGSPVRVIA